MIKRKPLIVFIGLLLLTGLSACSPRAVREAVDVVRVADSLRAEGQMYDDSSQLAQTYETLRSIPLPFRRRMSCEHSNRDWLGLGSLYAHACYHYGRLLREKDNPVAAMECFINASHARTRDYHILGRVYSNMGSICHLAGEYQLSYDMYERSADMFLQDGDTLMYYYDLNNMAIELAEQGEKTATMEKLLQIEKQCVDSSVLSKTNETKAEMYYKTQQYDSAIYYVNILTEQGYNLPTGMLIKAQAFSYLEEKDSALYYAHIVANETRSTNDLYNALYILSHDDSTLIKEEVLKLTSQRDDLHTYEVDVKKTEHSKAAQLLALDINRKKNLQWLYAIIVTISIISVVIYTYRKHQKRKHSLLSQKINSLSNAYSEIQSNKIANIEQVCETLRASSEFTNELCWREYNKMCKIADDYFYLLTTKLQQKQVLNEQEIRLCILVLIDYSNIQIAQILSYAVSGVGKLKYRVAKKLGVDSKNLRKHLLWMAIDEPFEP